MVMSARARLLLMGCFVAAALVCARLGLWQVRRLQARRAANSVALAARSQPPVELNRADTAGIALVNRRVRARGRYDHDHDIVLRGKVYKGVPGVEIVSPLLLDEGKAGAILVNRGFVPSPDAVTVVTDSLHEPGEVRVEGIALSVPAEGGAPLERGGETSWARLNLEPLRARLPYPISPVYLRQTPDSALPRFPRRLDPPPLDDGPHLSYAIQWFAFSIMAVVFGIVVLRQTGQRGKKNVSGEQET
jgi:surfeit locus 1 family protein